MSAITEGAAIGGITVVMLMINKAAFQLAKNILFYDGRENQYLKWKVRRLEKQLDEPTWWV